MKKVLSVLLLVTIFLSVVSAEAVTISFIWETTVDEAFDVAVSENVVYVSVPNEGVKKYNAGNGAYIGDIPLDGDVENIEVGDYLYASVYQATTQSWGIEQYNKLTGVKITGLYSAVNDGNWFDLSDNFFFRATYNEDSVRRHSSVLSSWSTYVVADSIRMIAVDGDNFVWVYDYDASYSNPHQITSWDLSGTFPALRSRMSWMGTTINDLEVFNGQLYVLTTGKITVIESTGIVEILEDELFQFKLKIADGFLYSINVGLSLVMKASISEAGDTVVGVPPLPQRTIGFELLIFMAAIAFYVFKKKRSRLK